MQDWEDSFMMNEWNNQYDYIIENECRLNTDFIEVNFEYGDFKFN